MRAIFISDVHMHLWKNHNPNNRRVRLQMEAVESVFKIAFSNKVPIVFGGDFFHDPDSLNNGLISLINPWLVDLFFRYPVEMYGISGNHDMEETNSFKKRSPSYIKTLSNTIKNLHCIDFRSVELGTMAIHGVPYLTQNEGIMEYINSIEISPKKFNILLLHTDFKGQKDTSGYEVGKGAEIIEEELSRFSIVVSGHIHKKGRIRDSIYSIGSPYQLRTSDIGGDFGYWILSDNFKMKFKSLKNGPKFTHEDPTDPTEFKVPKPMDKVELMKESKTIDLSNKPRLIKDYIKWLGDKSKNRSKYLLNLIERVEQDEES